MITNEILSSTRLIHSEVMIVWSENRTLAAYACENQAEKFNCVTLINTIMRRETQSIIKKSGGYDKTKFIFQVTTEDGKKHRYQGRIDVGSDTMGMFAVVEDHIKAFTEYTLNQPNGTSYAASSEEERAELTLWKDWAAASKKLHSRTIK